MSRGESEKRVERVSKLIEEAGALGLTGAREQGVSLHFNLDPDCDTVLVDRVQIQQVLVNLFRNALEAMAGSNRRELVTTNTKVGEDMIEIAVSDTGHGIDDEHRAGLFQTFFTTKETGMGVGLSISRTIVEAHGGRMWAENNPSGGAIFRFTLPAAPAKAGRCRLARPSTSSTTRGDATRSTSCSARRLRGDAVDSAMDFLDALPTSASAAWCPTCGSGPRRHR